MDLRVFLIQNKKLINIKELEKRAGCPVDTLQKYLQKKQGLPRKWEQPLKDCLRTFANSILDIKKNSNQE